MKQAKANHSTKLRVAVSSVASVDTGGFESGLLLTQLPDSSSASQSFIFLYLFIVVTFLQICILRVKVFRWWPQTLTQLHAL